MPEVTVHVCGPKKCDHVWDGEAPIMSDCFSCRGLGQFIVAGHIRTCARCDGKGSIETGSTRTCSKCNQSAFDVDMWEMP